MQPSEGQRRAGWIERWSAWQTRLACALLALGVVLSAMTAGEGGRARALSTALPAALEELAGLGGLLDEQGRAVLDERHEVEVVQSAGPAWAFARVGEAVEADAIFRLPPPSASSGQPGSGLKASRPQSLIRVEAIDAERGFAVQLRLWRNGWDLLLSNPIRRRAQPLWFALALSVLGLGLCLVRRAAWSLLLAGVTLVLGLAMSPLGASIPPFDGFADELSQAPLGSTVLRLVTRYESQLAGIVAAVIVFALVLSYFDHQRSKSHAKSISIPLAFAQAAAWTVGGLALVEGLTRSGWTSSLAEPMGLTAAACSLAGIGLALWTRREPEGQTSQATDAIADANV